MKTYNHLNDFYKEKFKERTLKICIDGSFTCPNRDGTKGYGGCIFCGEKGAGELTKNTLTIKDQVYSFLNSYRGKRANKFIVYFQSFTNTYAPIKTLKKKYDEALIDERIIGIDIDTRPDCINEEVCKLLASYKDKYYVMCELGLQVASNKLHKEMNQQITNEDFINAVNLLNKYGIDIIVHVMVGLPNQTHQDIIETVNLLNSIKYQGIKIHSTFILKNTVLEYLYNKNLYTPLKYEDYLEEVKYIINNISEEVVIHRITGDPPKESFVAPEWTLHKKRILNDIENYYRLSKDYQGCEHKKNKG